MEKLQTPSSKLQRSSKLQASRLWRALTSGEASRYHDLAGARTFLSAAALKGSHGLESKWTVAAIGACCGQECPMAQGFRLHPGGMLENSPTFQRWVGPSRVHSVR